MTTAAQVIDLDDRRRIDTTIDRLRLGGKKLTTNVAAAITDVTTEYGMDTAGTLVISIFDPKRDFVRSGQLVDGFKAAVKRTDIPGWDMYSLVSINKSGDSYDLTFEDDAVHRLRGHRGYDKVARDQMTRAEFIYKLIREVTHPTIKFVSPQIFVKQPIALSEDTIKLKNDKSRDPADGYGFDAKENITIHGARATSAQKAAIKAALDAAVKIRAPKTILVTVVNIMIYEGFYDLKTMNSFTQSVFYGGSGHPSSIAIFAANRAWEPYHIAIKNRTNTDPSDHGKGTYGKATDEARAAVNAYLGKDAYGYKGSVNRIQRQKFAKYEFTRGDLENGESEDTWTCITRLAQEVGWRLYCYRNTVYFVNDDDLRNRPEIARISEGTDGVFSLDWSVDVGQPLSEVNVSLTSERFGAPPGSVIIISGEGPMVDNQRWLVSNFRRSLFSPVADLTLAAPVAPSPEPAPEVKTAKTNIDTGQTTDDLAGTVRGQIVEIAKKQLARAGKDIHYSHARPIPTSFSVSPISTDCSGFVTMVYREAGAPDPNGQGYKGGGAFTGTLWSTGRAVSKPQPGDLVFYGNVNALDGHVAVVINDRECISHGSEGGPRRVSINYRTPLGYRTYPLGD